jgi:hypothetical protein
MEIPLLLCKYVTKLQLDVNQPVRKRDKNKKRSVSQCIFNSQNIPFLILKSTSVSTLFID